MYNLGFPEIAIILAILTCLAFEIAMIVNVLRSESYSTVTKVLWVVALIFLEPIAALYYFFAFYLPARKKRSVQTV